MHDSECVLETYLDICDIQMRYHITSDCLHANFYKIKYIFGSIQRNQLKFYTLRHFMIPCTTA